MSKCNNEEAYARMERLAETLEEMGIALDQDIPVTRRLEISAQANIPIESLGRVLVRLRQTMGVSVRKPEVPND